MQEVSDLLLESIAERLKAMGNPSRLRILHALEEGEVSVNKILDKVGGSQANVSKHLNVLRSADLVTRRREGIKIYYRISDEAVLSICRTVCDSLLDRAQTDLETLQEGRTLMVADGRR